MFVLASSIIFIAITSFVGIYLSRSIDTIKGYALADRSLPLFISTATVFATWFGAEAIMGVPESFMEHGLVGIISDPIGAFICLLVLGLFFARRFYSLNLISIVDFFRDHFGRTAEVLLGLAISISYVGWIAAQFTAFGSIISFISENTLSLDAGIFIGALIITLYTFKGGMLAVAINDFIQATIISISLVVMFFYITPVAGGPLAVLNYAIETHRLSFHFDADYPNYTYLIGVLLSMIAGAIPQQDTFQRITSAKSASVAVHSTILGAFIYFFITLIPIFIVLASAKSQQETGMPLPEDFNVYILEFVIKHTPPFIQFFFFGSLFAAILSTASGTILATSVVLSRNVIGEWVPKERALLAARLTLVMVTFGTSLFAMISTNSIHELVEDSGKVSMVTAFFPLILGLFWKKTNYVGILVGFFLSTGVWLAMMCYQNFKGTHFYVAPELVGTALSFLGIVAGSLLWDNFKSSTGGRQKN